MVFLAESSAWWSLRVYWTWRPMEWLTRRDSTVWLSDWASTRCARGGRWKSSETPWFFMVSKALAKNLKTLPLLILFGVGWLYRGGSWYWCCRHSRWWVVHLSLFHLDNLATVAMVLFLLFYCQRHRISLGFFNQRHLVILFLARTLPCTLIRL